MPSLRTIETAPIPESARPICEGCRRVCVCVCVRAADESSASAGGGARSGMRDVGREKWGQEEVRVGWVVDVVVR